MMKRLKVFTACAVAILAVAAPAQITKQGKGYLFRLKFKPGAVSKQTMLMDADVVVMKQTVTNTITQKVISVDKKGVGTVKVTTSGMLINGKPSSMGEKAQTTTLKMDSRGIAVGAASTAGNLGSMQMPKDAIPVGHKWAGEIKVAQAQSVMKANYTFKGLRSIGGVQVAEIVLSVKMSGMAPMAGSGSMFVRTDNGMGHGMNMTLKGSISMGQGSKPTPISMQIKVTPN